MPNEWLEQFNLPIADADVLSRIRTGTDSPTWMSGRGTTNPTDKDSHPAYLTKLKMKVVSAGAISYQISLPGRRGHVRDQHERPEGADAISQDRRHYSRDPIQDREIHGEIRGEQSTARPYDVSELMLEHEETKEQLTLVKEKVAISPESVATFVYTWGGPREIHGEKRPGIFIETAGGNQI